MLVIAWKVIVFDGECDWKYVAWVELDHEPHLHWEPKMCFSDDETFVLVLVEKKYVQAVCVLGCGHNGVECA